MAARPAPQGPRGGDSRTVALNDYRDKNAPSLVARVPTITSLILGLFAFSVTIATAAVASRHGHNTANKALNTLAKAGSYDFLQNVKGWDYEPTLTWETSTDVTDAVDDDEIAGQFDVVLQTLHGRLQALFGKYKNRAEDMTTEQLLAIIHADSTINNMAITARDYLDDAGIEGAYEGLEAFLLGETAADDDGTEEFNELANAVMAAAAKAALHGSAVYSNQLVKELMAQLDEEKSGSDETNAYNFIGLILIGPEEYHPEDNAIPVAQPVPQQPAAAAPEEEKAGVVVAPVEKKRHRARSTPNFGVGGFNREALQAVEEEANSISQSLARREAGAAAEEDQTAESVLDKALGNLRSTRKSASVPTAATHEGNVVNIRGKH